MKKLNLFLACIIVSFQLFAFPAIENIENEILDQSQNISSGRTFSPDTWQSFTPSQKGYLSKIQAYHYSKLQTGTLYIYKGEGTSGELLHQQSYSANGTGLITFRLTDKVEVDREVKYTFRLDNFSWFISKNNDYPRGRSSKNSNKDMFFNTFIIPFNEEIDQNQNSSSGTIYSSDNWQSFTAGSSGFLTSVRAYHYSTEETGTLIIYEGEGVSRTEVHRQPYTASGTAFLFFPITTPIRLEKDSKYSFRFTNFRWFKSKGNDYSGGRTGKNTMKDMVFQTYIMPTLPDCCEQEVIETKINQPSFSVTEEDISPRIQLRNGGTGFMDGWNWKWHKDKGRRFSKTGASGSDYLNDSYIEIRAGKVSVDLAQGFQLMYHTPWGETFKLFDPILNSSNKYKSTFDDDIILEVHSDNSFTYYGDIYVGYDPEPDPVFETYMYDDFVFSLDQYFDAELGPPQTARLDLRMRAFLYKRGTQKALDIVVSEDSRFTAGLDGIGADTPENRAYYLHSLIIKLEPVFDSWNGENEALIKTVELGPSTTPLKGTDSWTTSVSASAGPTVGTSGPSFGGNIGVSRAHTVSLDLTDFRIIDESRDDYIQTNYKLDFTELSGAYDEPKDLLDPSAWLGRSLSPVPLRSKENMSFFTKGTWTLPSSYNGIQVYRVSVTAKLAAVETEIERTPGIFKTGQLKLNSHIIDLEFEQDIPIQYWKID